VLDPDLHKDRSLANAVRGKRVLITGGSSGIGAEARPPDMVSSFTQGWDGL
jgi:hypothetical protein